LVVEVIVIVVEVVVLKFCCGGHGGIVGGFIGGFAEDGGIGL
jgi:hypothetical protein